MKIIEKKCPNCGANLDFKVGERDVDCKSCRRKFAIEYNHEDNFDELDQADLNSLSANDFDLTSTRKKIGAIIALMAFFAIIVAASIITINLSRDDFDSRAKDAASRNAEESRRRQEEFEEKREQNQKEFDEYVQQQHEEYERAVDKMKNGQ